MTDQKLQEINKLKSDIEELERLQSSVRKQPCEWIQFTFGNGSNKEAVCNDATIISIIRDKIDELNQQKLDKLKQQFEQL